MVELGMSGSPTLNVAPLALRSVSIQFELGNRLVKVVDDLSIEVAAGTVHCIAGRSGSGKTSVLRVAAGFEEPSSGTVAWGDHELANLAPTKLEQLRSQSLGYLDQTAPLVPDLTALENASLAAMRFRRRERRRLFERAQCLLDELGLENRVGNLPAALSGGEQQRVAFTRALLLRPRLIIVDEPTASLDRATADLVITRLLRHASEGAVVLASTHDPALVNAANHVTELEQASG